MAATAWDQESGHVRVAADCEHGFAAGELVFEERATVYACKAPDDFFEGVLNDKPDIAAVMRGDDAALDDFEREQLADKHAVIRLAYRMLQRPDLPLEAYERRNDTAAIADGAELSDEQRGVLELLAEHNPHGYDTHRVIRAIALCSLDSATLAGDVYGSGVYPTASLLRHSCAANAVMLLRGDTARVYAHRPIAAGEPVTISYVSELDLLPIARRHMALRDVCGVDFVCHCERCECEREQLGDADDDSDQAWIDQLDQEHRVVIETLQTCCERVDYDNYFKLIPRFVDTALSALVETHHRPEVARSVFRNGVALIHSMFNSAASLGEEEMRKLCTTYAHTMLNVCTLYERLLNPKHASTYLSRLRLHMFSMYCKTLLSAHCMPSGIAPEQRAEFKLTDPLQRRIMSDIVGNQQALYRVLESCRGLRTWCLDLEGWVHPVYESVVAMTREHFETRADTA